MIIENNIDIAALAETETLDVQGVLKSLKLQSQDWKVSEICPETDIKVLTKSSIHISVHREDKGFLLILRILKQAYRWNYAALGV